MINAIDDKIIVSELKRNKTAGGIVLPSTVSDPQAYGRIMSLGDKCANKSLKEGDIIVYPRMGGQAISMSNKMYCCVPYEIVYGILTDEGTLSELEEIELAPIEEVIKQQQEPSSLIKAV